MIVIASSSSKSSSFPHQTAHAVACIYFINYQGFELLHSPKSVLQLSNVRLVPSVVRLPLRRQYCRSTNEFHSYQLTNVGLVSTAGNDLDRFPLRSGGQIYQTACLFQTPILLNWMDHRQRPRVSALLTHLRDLCSTPERTRYREETILAS